MAKTKQQQQQHLVNYLTICLVVLLLLMNVGSVSASSISFDGTGNMLQQQQQQHEIESKVLEHNYIMGQSKQSPTPLKTKNLNILADPDYSDILKNNLNEDLTRQHINFGDTLKPMAMVKRAPAGFLGMRGKKLYDDDDDDNNDENENDLNIKTPWNELRNPQEVVNWDEYAKANVRRYKKAPTAFYGVRGKKFVNMNGVNPKNDNNRWHDFLQKLEEERIRDALLQDFLERLAGTKNDVTNDMAKRAPTGFTGVRGKRPFLDELDSSMETLSKRVLGNNAFIGVRGKKDVSHQTFKRSPAGAERYFFGFWKKSSSGRNGKRQRFVDFNNKFVAVRGKKSSYDDVPTLNAISNRATSSDSMNPSYEKRTPKGFLGMRGKRPSTTTDDV